MKLTRGEAMKALEEFYYTGKACKHGHISKRVTVSGVCCECLIDFRAGDWYSRQQFMEDLRKKKAGVA